MDEIKKMINNFSSCSSDSEYQNVRVYRLLRAQERKQKMTGNDNYIVGRIEHLVSHNGFPYSRDFAMHIKCKNTHCICHGYDGCTVPSNCEIDETGQCEWYKKQLKNKNNQAPAELPKAGDKP